LTDIVYFKPLITPDVTEKAIIRSRQSKRLFPVEMPYCINKTYVLKYAGALQDIKLNELPKSARVALK
jgi:hypothetical protein